MLGDPPGEEDDVAGRGATGIDRYPRGDDADAGGVDVDPVPLAPVDHLRVAGGDRHPGGGRRVAHRGDDPREGLHREPLLEDQPAGEGERPGAAHREIVDRAVDGERADVAAGEESGWTT